MADENKEYVVKLTAETDQFVSNIKGIDKMVNNMNHEIAVTNRLFNDMAVTFRLMAKDAQSFGSSFASGLVQAQKGLEEFMKLVSQSASNASGMQQAVKNTQDAVKGIGDNGKKVSKVLKDTGKEASNAGQMMEQTSKKVTKDATKEAEILNEASEKSAEASRKRIEEWRAESKEKQKAIDLDKQMRDDAKAAEKQSIVATAAEEQKSSNFAQNVDVKHDDADRAFANMGGNLSKMVDNIRAKLNPAWAESERRAARLSARINELRRQQENIANARYHSDMWNDYSKQMQNARAALNALENERRAIEYQMRRTDVFDTDMKETEAFKELKQQYRENASAMSDLRKEYELLKVKRDALNEGAGRPGTDNPEHSAIGAEIVALERQRDMILASGSGLLGKFRKRTHSESKKISTILKNTLKHIKSFFSKVTHLSNGKGAERGLKRIANAFTRLWGMFKTRLKRRFISAVFEDAKSDMVQLAKAFPSMNDAISNVVNSAKALGAQLIAILQPIITAVGPLVTKVLDAATVAADKIAQFTAKLFGQNTYGKATKGNYDFVKSMDETTKSVSDANNALTDYSSNLLGFDKLNQLQAVGDNSKASISAVNTDPVQDNAFNKWAEELKELWDNKDWDGFGRKLAEGLNTAVNWINSQDWDALSDKVTGFIANIQEAFNGFIDAFDAEAVGTAIANIGNLLIKAWNQLVKPVEEGGFDFRKLGEKIGTIIVTALKDIKWDEAGTAFGNTGNRLVELMRGILETKFTDAEGEHTLGYGIGKAISTFITNALHSINTDDWATIIADLFENLLDMFIQIFSSGPELGEKIAEILNKSLQKIPAGKLGEALSGLSRTFNSLIEHIHWGDVVSKLGEALSHVDIWSVLKSIFYLKMGKGIGKLSGGLLGGLFGGGSGGGLSIKFSLGTVLEAAIIGISEAVYGILGLIERKAVTKAVESTKNTIEMGRELYDMYGGNAPSVYGALVWMEDTYTRDMDQLKKDDPEGYQHAVDVENSPYWKQYQDYVSRNMNSKSDLGFEEFVEGIKLIPDDLNAIADFAKGYNELRAQFPHAGISFGDYIGRNGDITPEDYGRLYKGLPIDGQTNALTEAVNNNTTALQSIKAGDITLAKDIATAASQMKALVDSMSQDVNEGQPVNLMLDSYKFGEVVLKTLGTYMHTRIATT